MSNQNGEPQKKVTESYRKNWEKIFKKDENKLKDVVELEIVDSGC